MKSIGKFLLTISLMLICLVSFVACGSAQPTPKKLAKPENFVFDTRTATLSWNPVEGAEFYFISINGPENEDPANGQKTETASYSLRYLTPDIYRIRIVADSEKRENGYLAYEQSDWTEVKSYSVYAEFKDNYTVLPNQYVRIDGVGEYFSGGSLIIPDFFKANTSYVPDFEYANPDDIGLHPIHQIDANAFKGNNNITSVEIGENIWNIFDGAFENCGNLVTLDLSRAKNLRSIGSKAFYGTQINQIILPEHLIISEVGADAFEGTPWLNEHPDFVLQNS